MISTAYKKDNKFKFKMCLFINNEAFREYFQADNVKYSRKALLLINVLNFYLLSILYIPIMGS